MSKDRLAAFSDAVIAIIMTILVLELEKPKTISLEGLWEIKGSFISYIVSFVWLGCMWINHHNEWSHVKYINKKTVNWAISVLFFSSFFPYAMSLVDVNLDNKVAQGFYGIIVLLVTFMNIMLTRNLIIANPQSDYLKKESLLGKRLLLLDIAIKMIGFILTITIYPPAMLIAVIVTLVFIIFPTMFLETRERY